MVFGIFKNVFVNTKKIINLKYYITIYIFCKYSIVFTLKYLHIPLPFVIMYHELFYNNPKKGAAL